MKSVTSDGMMKIVFACLSFALVLSWGNNVASAQENDSSLSIAASGQVIVKNARVVSVSGNTIVARTVWGNTSISFTVQTSGSTRFVPSSSSADALNSLAAGQLVSFSGTMVGTLEKPTVYASVFKNSSLIQDSVNVLGIVEEVDAKTQTFVIAADDARTSIYIPKGAIMSRDGGYASVGDIRVGDSAKVTGKLDAANSTLEAQRVTIVTPQEAAPSEPSDEDNGAGSDTSGFVVSLLNWLKGSRGMLSVR